MFERILVPLDGSPLAKRALPIAARVARASRGALVLVRVVEQPHEYGGALAQTPRVQDELLEAALAEASSYLTLLANSPECAGIEIATVVLAGAPAEHILAAAEESRVDLIIMGSRRRTGFARWALGSVAQKVARHSPAPVLIVPPVLPGYEDGLVETRHALRALVAVDGSALAEAAIVPAAQLVGALATPSQGVLHLAQVVQLPTVASESPSWQSALRARERLLQEATTYLSRLAETTGAGVAASLGLRITWSIAAKEDVAEALINMAEIGEDTGAYEDEGCDLIAMATHGRGGLERWMIGSITERVLTGTKLPMLVVRPPGQGATTGSKPVQDEGIAG